MSSIAVQSQENVRMRCNSRIAKLVVTALVAAASFTPAMAQTVKGGLYVFHTKPIEKCPGLDWHITLDPNGQLTGFVAWDRMQHMARLAGKLDKNGAFRMNAKEVGGAGRTAIVKGAAAGDYITTSIENSGTGCDNQVLQVPRFAGGLEGGGG